MKSLHVLCFALGFLLVDACSRNTFDITRGCKQFDGSRGYDDPVQYFLTSRMEHVGRSGNTLSFRFGILGPGDGHIRFGSSPFPYGMDVIEIVLSGWANTKSAGRRQHRTPSNSCKNIQLAEAKTPGMLSPFRPTMFVMELVDNRSVRIKKDGESTAFLEFNDNNRVLPIDYIGFTRYNSELVFFYDCPLRVGSVLENCPAL